MPSEVLRYPADIAKFNKWLRFDVRKGRHVGRQMLVDESKTPDDVIMAAALYLPTSALRSSMTVDYDTTEFSGMMMEMAAQAVDKLASMRVGQNAGEAFDKASGDVYNQLKNAYEKGDAGDVGEFLKATAMRAASVPFGTQVEALAGQKVNPRTDIIFSAQQYRSWTFEYIFIPRTLTEAQNIEKIVKMFRFYMLPVYRNANSDLGPKAAYMMGYPYEWSISIYGSGASGGYGPFQTGTNPQGNVEPPPPGSTPLEHVGKIGRSVLRTCTVDQAGGGKVAFVGERGNTELYPLVTAMTLEFQEVILLGRDQRDILGVTDVNEYPDPRAN